jgi:hypothetical protein
VSAAGLVRRYTESTYFSFFLAKKNVSPSVEYGSFVKNEEIHHEERQDRREAA